MCILCMCSIPCMCMYSVYVYVFYVCVCILRMCIRLISSDSTHETLEKEREREKERKHVPLFNQGICMDMGPLHKSANKIGTKKSLHKDIKLDSKNAIPRKMNILIEEHFLWNQLNCARNERFNILERCYCYCLLFVGLPMSRCLSTTPHPIISPRV